VPFQGQSAQEIMVRHLADLPDLSRVPEPFVPILRKALAKDPEQRYVSLSDFARAVEATAGATPAPMAAPAAPVPARAAPAPVPPSEPPTPAPALSVGELCSSLAWVVPLAALGTLAWSAVADVKDRAAMVTFFFLTVLACWAVLLSAWRRAPRPGGDWLGRVVLMLLGGLLGLAGLWLEGGASAPASTGALPPDLAGLFCPDGVTAARVGYPVYFTAAFGVLPWRRLADRHRPSRFRVAPVLLAGFWGLVLLLLARPQPGLAVGVLVVLAMVVQLVSPWRQQPRAASEPLRMEAAS
jgi:hypothetical protein